MNNGKTTILFYINAIHDGGAERVILQLAHRFSESGYRSILVTSFVDNDFEYPIPDGVERISMESQEIKQSRFKRNLDRIRKLRKYCKEYNPAVLVSFMAEPNFRAICAAFGLPVKTVVSVRNDPDREYGGKLGRFIGKVMLPMADGCVFQTDDAKMWFPKKLQSKSAVIMNETTKEFFNIEYVGGNDIVTLGRLAGQKNHKLLIEAFASIADKYPGTDLKIYGDGPLKESLCQLIEKMNMSERIHLMGSTKNVGEVLSTAKIFVLSSDYEGMPNALLEALTVGVPAISTDCPCGGPKALIKNGVNGLLVKIRDKEELTAALKYMLDNGKAADEMGRKAKECAAKYHPDNIFSEWKNYIEYVIKSN